MKDLAKKLRKAFEDVENQFFSKFILVTDGNTHHIFDHDFNYIGIAEEIEFVTENKDNKLIVSLKYKLRRNSHEQKNY